MMIEYMKAEFLCIKKLYHIGLESSNIYGLFYRSWDYGAFAIILLFTGIFCKPNAYNNHVLQRCFTDLLNTNKQQIQILNL